jgi:hypothetical protein
MNHPNASLPNILTFMWCIWKSRNDNLFDKKARSPYQVHQMAQAIKNNMEMLDNTHDSSSQIQVRPQDSSLQVSKDQKIGHASLQPGSTLRTDLTISGPKVYSDAALKARRLSGATPKSRSGLGIFYDFQEGQHTTKVLIQASTVSASSPLHAEALALLLAAKIAAALKLSQPTFLTDNLPLAKAVIANSMTDPQVLWEIRGLVSEFKQVSQDLHASVYHINRDLNGVAHNCSQQAFRNLSSEPIFSCISSAHTKGACPTALAIQILDLQGFVLHDVTCL